MTKSSEAFAKSVRAIAVEMVHESKSSHIGSALSIADIIAGVYARVMRIDTTNPKSSDRDRFILSKGHACSAVYGALFVAGILSKGEIDSFGQSGSPLMTHISHKVKGVEFSTGSLGHGLSFGVGKALSAKLRGLPWRTFVLVGDGELDEGSIWEALMLASHHELANLKIIVDANNLQSLTTVDKTLALEPLVDKFKSFGCRVLEIDGHDHLALETALEDFKGQSPTIVLARTTKGKGVSFMENSVEWHYKSPSLEEKNQALDEIRGLV